MVNDNVYGTGRDGFSLERNITCRVCNKGFNVDMADYSRDSSTERPMGPDILHSFHFEIECPHCGAGLQVRGYISEYPAGSSEHEEINVEKSI